MYKLSSGGEWSKRGVEMIGGFRARFRVGGYTKHTCLFMLLRNVPGLFKPAQT